MATSLEDITSLRLWKGIIAEFVGTLLLVLVGCGSCISFPSASGAQPEGWSGAVVGAGILYGLTPEGYQGALGSTLVSQHIDPGKGLGVEIFITFVLVFTVFASVDSKRKDLNGFGSPQPSACLSPCAIFGR
nr:hypothetical protein BaRGS_029812 [Batillaria attramentaria]